MPVVFVEPPEHGISSLCGISSSWATGAEKRNPKRSIDEMSKAGRNADLEEKKVGREGDTVYRCALYVL
jgi:hypothetical protein